MKEDSVLETELEKIRRKKAHDGDSKGAQRRFDEWRDKDPFPNVKPNLLGCAQFCEYIAKTGMIHPFEVEKDLIKMVTYDIKIGGRFLMWDKSGNKISRNIEEGEFFEVPSNSISFVTLEPYFRIPEYIVPRFNLKIKHVYKGLLLGTGPVVDPGFQGRLSIPLHNLTDNDYTLSGGKELISMEFTKIYPNDQIKTGDCEIESNLHVPLDVDESKVDRDVRDYVRRAVGSRDVRSSIPQLFKDARETVDKVENRSYITFWAAILTISFGFFTLLAVTYDIGNDALAELGIGLERKVRVIDNNKAQLDSLSKQIRSLEEKLEND